MQLVALLGLLGTLEVRPSTPLIARVTNLKYLGSRDCDGPFTRRFR